MVFNVKIFVVHPSCARSVFDHPLAEPAVFEQPCLDTLAQRGMGNAWLEHPDTDDHHQVFGRVHAQPSGVHFGHALA